MQSCLRRRLISLVVALTLLAVGTLFVNANFSTQTNNANALLQEDEQQNQTRTKAVYCNQHRGQNGTRAPDKGYKYTTATTTDNYSSSTKWNG